MPQSLARAVARCETSNQPGLGFRVCLDVACFVVFLGDFRCSEHWGLRFVPSQSNCGGSAGCLLKAYRSY